MKATRLYEQGAPENLKIEEVPMPEPGPNQVLVKVAAVGICGHDQSDRNGLTRPHVGLPVTIGHEVAGTVTAIGDRVNGFAVGDRVATKQQTHCGECTNCRTGREIQCDRGRLFNYGGWAEYVVLPAPGLLKVPDNIDLKLASVVACAVGTTLNALRNVGEVQPGENVLVTGAGGGLGLHGMQVAKALGGRVVAVTSSPSKVDRLRELGADDVVVAQGRDYWEAIVKATNGGPQVVLDNVGHPDLFSPIFRSLARKARYVFTGQVYREKIDLYPAFLFGKETQIRGAGPGGMADFADSLKLVSEGKVTPVIDPMSLDDAVEANRRLDASDFLGRGVLVP